MGKVIRRSIQKRWGILLSLVVLVTPAWSCRPFTTSISSWMATSSTTGRQHLRSTGTTSSTASGIQGEPALPAGFTASGFDRDFLTNANGTFNTNDNTTFATGSKDTLPIGRVAVQPRHQCERQDRHRERVRGRVHSPRPATRSSTSPWSGSPTPVTRTWASGSSRTMWAACQPPAQRRSRGTTGRRPADRLRVHERRSGQHDRRLPMEHTRPRRRPHRVSEHDTCRARRRLPHSGTSAGDPACATANTGTVSVPWLTAAKTTGVGHTLPVAQFFEGGLNLTKCGLGGKCFNVFIGDTRSSQSLTATLFDFARGVIGECASDDCDDAVDLTSAPRLRSPANASLTVTDSALVTVAGVASLTGEVVFHLCGPFASDAMTLCGTGGVLAGTKPVTASGNRCLRFDDDHCGRPLLLAGRLLGLRPRGHPPVVGQPGRANAS